MSEISDRLGSVRAKVAAAAVEAGREPASINLIAVSKRQSDERIAAAAAAGHRSFGENQVQEAQRHWAEQKENNPGLQLHLIGPLQSNKTRDAVALFDVVHTVDRPKIAVALAREFDRQDRQLPCYVEINTGGEASKAGISPEDADAFIKETRDNIGLPIVGLMCIPPAAEPPSLHFALLAKIAARNGLGRLSMGMSHDFELAIKLGATDVRVGTAIFGEREDKAT